MQTGTADRFLNPLEISPVTHRLKGIRYVPSPNANARPAGTRPELIVIHGISLPPGCFGGPGVEQLFTNTLRAGEHPCYREMARMRVSAHVFIRRAGELIQFVPFDARAWHAGESCFEGRANCNDFSVGIELEGCDNVAYEPAQYRRLAALVSALTDVYPGLSAERVVGHCDIAPGRKTDPGPLFDRGFMRFAGAS